MIAPGTEWAISTVLVRGRRDADAVWARALDEATVLLLRATSPPGALARAEGFADERDGESYANEPYRALVRNVAPRAVLVVCEDESCAAAFWTMIDDQRFCSVRCRQRTAMRRFRRVQRLRPFAPTSVLRPRERPLSRGQERHRGSCRCRSCRPVVVA